MGFNSLLGGTFRPAAPAAERDAARKAAATWANLIFDVLDHVFNFPAVEHTGVYVCTRSAEST